MTRFAPALLATALIVGGTAASAATATFDLSLSPGQSTSYNNLLSSFSLIDNGLTATFTAGSFTSISGTGGGTISSATLANDPHIGRYQGGAGVVNSRGESHFVDSSGRADFISIGFDEAVTITSVSFGLFENGYYGNDNFRWMYDQNLDGSIGAGDFISTSQNSNPFTEFGDVSSKLFAIGAFDSRDEWKLKSVTFDFILAPPPPSPVPLPAGGLLLAGALGGLAALRRRRKAA